MSLFILQELPNIGRSWLLDKVIFLKTSILVTFEYIQKERPKYNKPSLNNSPFMANLVSSIFPPTKLPSPHTHPNYLKQISSII